MSAFKLYYTPTSCGAASFIVASLAGATFDSEQVDLSTHKTQSGADFYKINKRGNVPTIVFPDGTMFNQGIATLTYLADLAPHSGLAPTGPARYNFLNKLAFVNSELHPSFGRLISSDLSEKQRMAQKEMAVAKARYFLDDVMDGDFVLGDTLSAADVYAYIVISWAGFLNVDLSAVPKVQEFCQRVKAVPGVQAAHDKMNAAM